MKHIVEEITVGKIKERIKENLRKAREQHPDYIYEQNTMTIATMPQKKIHVNDLLGHHGEQFIKEVYRNILLREPDPAGFSHYINLFLEGIPNEAILYYIATSPEAKEKQVELAGLEMLRKTVLKYRLMRGIKKIPIISNLFIWLYRRVKLPSRSYDLSKDFRGLQISMNRFIDALNQRIDSLRNELADRDKTLEEINNRLNKTKDALYQELNNQEAEIAEKDGIIQELINRVDNLESELADRDRTIEDINGKPIVLGQATDFMREERANHRSAEIVNIEGDFIPVITAGNVVVTKVEGFIMGFPCEEWRLVAYQVFKGNLEPGLVKLFKSYVKDGMVVIDVGANVGLYTLIAASLIGNEGKVYSFEPTPRTFDLLKNNMQVNGFLESDRIILRQMAVMDRSNKKIKLYIYKNNLTHNTLFPNPEDTDFIESETTSLDDALSNESRVDIVKIDAEGSEPFILRGMKKMIEKNPQITVFMEFAPVHLRRAGINEKGFIDEIHDYGFSIKRVDDLTGEILPISQQELLDCFSINVILSKEVKNKGSNPML
ncbi:MAG: FkbM family methyltransferase [Nitrospirota bacterium]